MQYTIISSLQVMMLQKATINYRRSISLSFTLLMYAGLVIARYVQQQVLL